MSFIAQLFDSKEDNNDIILWCLEKDTNKPLVVTIKNFIGWIYLELSPKIKNPSNLLLNLKNHFSSYNFDGIVEEKKKLYYYQSSPTLFLRLFFSNISHQNGFVKTFRNNFIKKDGDVPPLFIWECDKKFTSNLRKFYNMTSLKYGDWIEFKNLKKMSSKDNIYLASSFYIDIEEKNFKLTDHLLREKYLKSIMKTYIPDIPIISRPYVCSFDIESYAENHNKFVNANNEGDVMYMITMVFQRYLNENKKNEEEPKKDKENKDIKGNRKRYLITLENTKIDKNIITADPRFPESNTTILLLKSEKDFFKVIGETLKTENPDILIGYNIHRFDYNYMITRQSKILKHSVWNQYYSRNTEKPVESVIREWKSSAYGNVKDIYPCMEGRLSIDILPFIKQILMTKLVSYKLDDVSSHFLKNNKDDIDIQDTFRWYKKAFEEYNNKDYTTSYDMCKVGLYGLQDSELVLDLFEKINVWPILLEFSSAAGITIEKIFGGQQIRVMSLLNELCYKNDIVIDYRDYKNYIFKKNERSDRNEEEREVIEYDYNESDNDTSDTDSNDSHPKLSKKEIAAQKKIEEEKLLKKELLKEGIIKFKGAYVVEPKPGKYNNVIGLDFSSLYPSIMRDKNISYETFNVKYSPLEDVAFSGRMLEEYEYLSKHHLRKTQDSRYEFKTNSFYPAKLGEPSVARYKVDFHDTLKDHDPEADFYSFEFSKEKVGLLPSLVTSLITRRNEVKGQIKEYSKKEKSKENELIISILDAKQLALKIIANSTYGFVGAQQIGKIPFTELSMAITAIGRQYIKKVNKYIEDKYDGKIVYGDSVIGKTPILIRIGGNTLKYIYIEDLERYINTGENKEKYINTGENNPSKWIKKYPLSLSTKEYINLSTSSSPIEVFSNKGFTRIKEFIRHPYTHSLYKVTTKKGYVMCTGDHSLIKSNLAEIKPKDLKIGETRLLHKSFRNEFLLKFLKMDFSINLNQFKIEINRLFSSPLRVDFAEVRCNNLIEMSEKIFLIETFFDDIFFYKIQNHSSFLVSKMNPNLQLQTDVVLSCEKIESKGYKMGCLPPSSLSSSYYSNIYNSYVYDLSTEDETFHTGPGELIVHNTDSSMFIIPSIKSSKECNEVGIKLAKELSDIFEGGIMKLEFEKAMRMICFKKKKYAAFLLDNEGNFSVDKMLFKGITLARRDNCSIVRDLYKELLIKILSYDDKAERSEAERGEAERNLNNINECYKEIFQTVLNILKGKVNIEKLALVNEIKDGYKKKNYKTFVFATESEKLGRIISPGERIKYVIVKDSITTSPVYKEVKSNNLGLKMRDIKYLDLKNEEIDCYYYITHNFKNAIDQLFDIAFPNSVIKSPFKYFEKCTKAKIKEIKKIDKERFKKIKIDEVRLDNKEYIEVIKNIIKEIKEN